MSPGWGKNILGTASTKVLRSLECSRKSKGWESAAGMEHIRGKRKCGWEGVGGEQSIPSSPITKDNGVGF